MNTNYAYELKQKVFTVIQISQFFFLKFLIFRWSIFAVPEYFIEMPVWQFPVITETTLLYTINISKTYIMDVSKTSFVRYGCLKNPFLCYGCFQKHLLYVMDVFKDIFCTLWMSQRRLFMLWMSQRHLLYVMDVSKTSFIRYEYPETNSETAWVH